MSYLFMLWPFFIVVMFVADKLSCVPYPGCWQRNHERSAKPLLVYWCCTGFKGLLWFMPFALLLIVFSVEKSTGNSMQPTSGSSEVSFGLNYHPLGLFWARDNPLSLWITPKRGDVVSLTNPYSQFYMLGKRIIGLPGDNISYIHKTLWINGKKIPTHYVKSADFHLKGKKDNFAVYDENLLGVHHQLLINLDKPAENFYQVKVPVGQVFVMGDNRDESNDSRYFGCVSESNLVFREFFHI